MCCHYLWWLARRGPHSAALCSCSSSFSSTGSARRNAQCLLRAHYEPVQLSLIRTYRAAISLIIILISIVVGHCQCLRLHNPALDSLCSADSLRVSDRAIGSHDFGTQHTTLITVSVKCENDQLAVQRSELQPEAETKNKAINTGKLNRTSETTRGRNSPENEKRMIHISRVKSFPVMRPNDCHQRHAVRRARAHWHCYYH